MSGFLVDKTQVIAGAKNLLLNCAFAKPGEKLLIAHERSDLGWYDNDAPGTVGDVATSMGLEVSYLEVENDPDASDSILDERVSQSDLIIYFARLGDRTRFAPQNIDQRVIVSYARDARSLASSFARVDYQCFMDLKNALNSVLISAKTLELSCPLGTSLIGRIDASQNIDDDVTVRRFPMGVPQPILAREFSGRIALARYLVPTGSQSYTPAVLPLQEPILAHVDCGRIESFSGNPDVADAVSDHYRKIGQTFNIDPWVVHSWHVGLHPGCDYADAPDDNPDRWLNTVFCNPRVLHFHTCGNYAPGEICLNVIDPTVKVDGITIWDRGSLYLEDFEETAACIDRWPALGALVDGPCGDIGESVANASLSRIVGSNDLRKNDSRDPRAPSSRSPQSEW